MQHTKSTTVRVYDRAGHVLGELKLPTSSRLADLESLRALGAVRVAVRQ